MMPRLISKREKIIICITVGVAAFAVVFKFIILPIMDKYEAVNNEIEITTAKLGKYRQLLANKMVIEEKYREFFVNLPKPEETAGNPIFELENLAKASGVRIVDIRPQATLRAKETIIDVRLEGAMEAYLKFIYNIENSTELFTIKKLQLTSKPNTPALEGNFSISQIPPAQ